MQPLQVLDLIVSIVAEKAGLKNTKRLFGDDRAPAITRLRDTCLYLIRQQTDLSFPEIGRAFRRDHSTIISAVKREELRLQRDVPQTVIHGITVRHRQFHEDLLKEIRVRVQALQVQDPSDLQVENA